MITSLKIFSLSSTVLSTVGLPVLLVYKGIDMFTGVHFGLMATTVFGACGSTLGLQWIFAPYVYTLETIPIRRVDDKMDIKQHDTTAEDPSVASAISSSSPFLLKATTRSIFLTRVEHVFDPESKDVTPASRAAIRPFCSFYANGKPLYIHEQMLTNNPHLSKALFVNQSEPIKVQKNPDPDDEFL
jgi:hypothetical protein